MLLDHLVLKAAGATSKKFEKGQRIFFEGAESNSYYQIESGVVDVVNYNEDGTAFIQGKYSMGQSLGISAVLLGEPFPYHAVAASDTIVTVLSRANFFEILMGDINLMLRVNLLLSQRLYKNHQIGRGIAIYNPEKRIETLLQVLKKEHHHPDLSEKFRLPFSRQEIAGMIGLRVETVIRAIKKMEQRGLVEIIRGKVYY